MPFEVYVRKVIRSLYPAVSVRSDGRINFNQKALEIIQNNDMTYVLLLWDKDKEIMALKPTDKTDRRAYRIGFRGKGGVGFQAKTFFDHVGYHATETQTYPVEWNKQEKILEIKLTPENVQKRKGRTGVKRG